MSKKRVYMVDCKKAIENGFLKEEIIKKVEKFFGLPYFQSSYKWDAIEYPILKKVGGRVMGTCASWYKLQRENKGAILIDWLNIDRDTKCLHRAVDSIENKEFNKDLL